MPQLVGLVLLGAGLYAGYRAIVRLATNLASELEPEVRRHAVTVRDLGALEYDPVSGVYRPARRSVSSRD
jgi:hypothetical protein